MQIAIYREWKRNTKRPVKTEKWTKRKQLCRRRKKISTMDRSRPIGLFLTVQPGSSRDFKVFRYY